MSARSKNVEELSRKCETDQRSTYESHEGHEVLLSARIVVHPAARARFAGLIGLVGYGNKVYVPGARLFTSPPNL